MKQYNVIIIGGGYAGVMCAQRLAAQFRGTGMTIVLINPRQNFVERLRLHESVGVSHNSPMRSFDLADVLSKLGVDFIEGDVTGIDRLHWCVDVQADTQEFQLGYERLVLAMGSRTAGDVIPGLDENAFVLETDVANGNDALRAAVEKLKAPNIVVVGAGATGVEVAAELALRPDAKVTLIDRSDFGGFVLPAVAKHIQKRLDAFGVILLENTDVSKVKENVVQIGAKEIPFDICVSTVGFKVAPPLEDAELPVGLNGRILTDGALRSIADDRIYVAGDAALPENRCGAPARMSVFFALTTGAFVAGAIADDFAGKKLRRFGYWTYGQAIGLGREAIGYNSFPFDRAVRPYFTGRTSFHLRSFFVWLLFQIMRMEGRVPGLPFYFGQPLRRTMGRGAGR